MLNGWTPEFAPEGGLALALLRGLWLACLLSSFGAFVFSVAVAPSAWRLMAPPLAEASRRGLVRLARLSLAGAMLAGAAWLAGQSGDMAGAETVGDALAALPTVLGSTLFGQILAVQAAALIVAAVAAGRSRWLALASCGAALALQAGHSHAWSMYGRPSLLLASDVTHLLAAGAWLGGLLPLALLVRREPPPLAAAAARAFSPLGMTCVAALAVTAGFQAWVLAGSLAGLAGTAYGWVLLVKLVLLLALVGIAARNRGRHTPALDGAAPDAARARLARSIGIEIGAGLAVTLAAGLLASLPPAMHLQPVWPFTERFSLDTIDEDPDFRREAVGAALALGGALALLVLAALLRRRAQWKAGWASVAAAAAVAWFAAPHLDLLFVEAYPTSFDRSPTGFAAGAIAEGLAQYPSRCAACHGARGRGDGPAAHGLAVPPADLTAGHLWMHSDGEMFWWLSHGIDSPQGGLAMPGFADSLSDEQRWDLIDAVRARNAGLAYAASGDWPRPVQAPDFQADCGGKLMRLSDLHGAVAQVTLTAGGARIAAAGRTCVADDGAVPIAYALVTGMPAGAGARVLVDGDGFLRSALPPGSTDWDDPARLADAVARIEAHPLAAAAPMRMDMSGGQMHM